MDKEIIYNVGNKWVDEDGETYFVVSEKSLEESKSKRKEYTEIQKKYASEHQFVNYNLRKADELMDLLTQSRRGMLVILSTYLNYKDKGNLLVHSNGKPLTTKAMKNILNCSKNTFYEFLNSCINNGIIIKNEDDTYSLNDIIAFRGSYNRKNAQYYSSMMIENIRCCTDYLTNQQIGLLYDIQKYLNFASMVLCKNPNESDINKLEPFTKDELAKELGLTRQQLHNKLKNLYVGNEYLFAEFKTLDDKRATKLIMNPNYVFRGSYSQCMNNVKLMTQKEPSLLFLKKK